VKLKDERNNKLWKLYSFDCLLLLHVASLGAYHGIAHHHCPDTLTSLQPFNQSHHTNDRDARPMSHKVARAEFAGETAQQAGQKRVRVENQMRSRRREEHQAL